jgi:hypothetical protein
MPNLSYWEAEIRRITVQNQPWQIVLKILISKLTRTKWTGIVPQVVKTLFCKLKALNSDPNLTPPKN